MGHGSAFYFKGLSSAIVESTFAKVRKMKGIRQAEARSFPAHIPDGLTLLSNFQKMATNRPMDDDSAQL
jgi:hypothetical protein